LIADGDRELLPASVVVAVDNLNQTFGGYGDAFDDLVEKVPAGPSGDDWLCLVLVANVRGLAEALRAHDAALLAVA
jgi:hypothetical protein